jgi:hypothetical protein
MSRGKDFEFQSGVGEVWIGDRLQDGLVFEPEPVDLGSDLLGAGRLFVTISPQPLLMLRRS